MTTADHYTYRITWSAEDEAYVATVAEFPSLSWIDADRTDALHGVEALLQDVLDDGARLRQEHAAIARPRAEIQHPATRRYRRSHEERHGLGGQRVKRLRITLGTSTPRVVLEPSDDLGIHAGLHMGLLSLACALACEW